MQKKILSFAFIASMLLVGVAFTSCDDDDDDDGYFDTESTISIENVVSMKEFVQSGTFGSILPGETVSIQFNAGKDQRLMFAMMYSYSNDLFFAPENPGLELFNSEGVAMEGDVSAKIHMWDNGTRVNEQPGPNVTHPGTAEAGNIRKVETQDAQGNLYRPASELVKLNLAYNETTSQFTLTIRNNSGGTINSTPLSGGVWVVSNKMSGKIVKEEPFFKEGEKSSAQLTALAETGNNGTLENMVKGMTGIVTELSPVIVVVYSGDVNPIYELDKKDGKIGLKELAQQGETSKLKESLQGMTNVRHVYVLGKDPIAPGEKVEGQFKAWNGDKIAYVTQFGYSNDWFYANSETIQANYKGDLTSKTALFDNGTGINQYPGAGNHQALFGGTPEGEDAVITRVGNTYPIPSVSQTIKVTIR